MQLIYLSSVPWASFAQRPHKFVEWFHANSGGDVLWIDPYPTRFPLLSDFRRLGGSKSAGNPENPAWLEVIRPLALPIEPLPGSSAVNGIMWRSLFNRVEEFARRRATMLVIGKPSVLALAVLKRLDGVTSIYDAMDDFPAFYSGFSRRAMCRREGNLIGRVTHVLASSTALKQRWSHTRPDVQLVPNGLDAGVLPPPKMGPIERGRNVLGYVGTIGPWFDWDWVIALAKARPADVVRLIGPMFTPSPHAIPGNVEVLSSRSHHDAMLAMQDFDVGLIPFKNTDLTVSVDPIKYYEYRALGLPVVSTDFGEMALRGAEDGTFLSKTGQVLNGLIQEALLYRSDDETIRQFTARNTWEARFNAARIM